MLANKLKGMEAAVRNYASTVYPNMAGKKALRFIDDNFRKEAWEGYAWKKRAKADRGSRRALLILHGTLRRGNRSQAMPGGVRIYNDVVYARVHNEGFRGTVNVSAHNRRLFRKYATSSVKTHRTALKKQHAGDAQVKAHTMKMNIPRRQFMPTAARPSPTLNREIQRQVTLDIYKILKANN